MNIYNGKCGEIMKNLQYLMLYLVGINNKTIIQIMNNVCDKDLKLLLSREYMSIQYKYNIDLSKYGNILSSNERINEIKKEANKIINKNKELGIKMVTIRNKYYPKLLSKIGNPPAIVYIKGANINKSNAKSIACVGTRTPSEFGIRATNSIVSSLAKEEFTIVSGLANGIDACAHRACLDNNGKTIAVLAHGLDIIYPKENISLSEEIISKGGTLISEYPVGTKPDKFRFVSRNRIVSGLSEGLLVIESKEKSGTMHTVNYALSEKKKVFCPIPIRKEIQNMGILMLLESGKAIGIKNRDSYDVIVHGLGYKIKKDSKKISELKSSKIKYIHEKCNMGENIYDFIKDIEFDSKSGVSVNKIIYTKFKEILHENNITVKEFFNAVISNTVEEYYKGDKNE